MDDRVLDAFSRSTVFDTPHYCSVVCQRQRWGHCTSRSRVSSPQIPKQVATAVVENDGVRRSLIIEIAKGIFQSCDESERNCALEVVGVLQRLLENLASAPADTRYRRVRLANPKISRVLQCPGAEEFLLSTCFVRGNDVLEVPDHRSDVDIVMAAEFGLEALSFAYSFCEGSRGIGLSIVSEEVIDAVVPAGITSQCSQPSVLQDMPQQDDENRQRHHDISDEGDVANKIVCGDDLIPLVDGRGHKAPALLDDQGCDHGPALIGSSSASCSVLSSSIDVCSSQGHGENDMAPEMPSPTVSKTPCIPFVVTAGETQVSKRVESGRKVSRWNKAARGAQASSSELSIASTATSECGSTPRASAHLHISRAQLPERLCSKTQSGLCNAKATNEVGRRLESNHDKVPDFEMTEDVGQPLPQLEVSQITCPHVSENCIELPSSHDEGLDLSEDPVAPPSHQKSIQDQTLLVIEDPDSVLQMGRLLPQYCGSNSDPEFAPGVSRSRARSARRQRSASISSRRSTGRGARGDDRSADRGSLRTRKGDEAACSQAAPTTGSGRRLQSRERARADKGSCSARWCAPASQAAEVLRPGDEVQARVVRITQSGVLFDLGDGQSAVLPVRGGRSERTWQKGEIALGLRVSHTEERQGRVLLTTAKPEVVSPTEAPETKPQLACRASGRDNLSSLELLAVMLQPDDDFCDLD